MNLLKTVVIVCAVLATAAGCQSYVNIDDVDPGAEGSLLIGRSQRFENNQVVDWVRLKSLTSSRVCARGVYEESFFDLDDETGFYGITLTGPTQVRVPISIQCIYNVGNARLNKVAFSPITNLNFTREPGVVYVLRPRVHNFRTWDTVEASDQKVLKGQAELDSLIEEFKERFPEHKDKRIEILE